MPVKKVFSIVLQGQNGGSRAKNKNFPKSYRLGLKVLTGPGLSSSLMDLLAMDVSAARNDTGRDYFANAVRLCWPRYFRAAIIIISGGFKNGNM
jgi:hypothetical protein